MQHNFAIRCSSVQSLYFFR